MNNDISPFSETFDGSVILKAAKGIKIWLLFYSFLVFWVILSASAFIYIFISKYNILIYLNIPNVLMLVITLLFCLKFSIVLRDINSSNKSESLAKAFKLQRNYLISLTAHVFLISVIIFVYVLYLFLYVRGMK